MRGVPKRSTHPGVHIASVQTEDGKVRKCFVKPGAATSPCVIIESIAWLLAKALNLPRPAYAAVLAVPIEKLKGKVKLDSSWSGDKECLAFCAEAVDGSNLAQIWDHGRWLEKRNIFRSREMSAVAAFDEWVNNVDRHMGNVLRRADGVHVPIDNEYALYEPVWKLMRPSINIKRQTILESAERVLGGKSFGNFKIEAARAAQNHQRAFADAKQEVVDTIDALVPDQNEASRLKKIVCDFLDGRAAPAWLASTLRVIV